MRHGGTLERSGTQGNGKMTDMAPFQIGSHLADDAPVESIRYLAGKSKAVLNALDIHTVGDLKRAGVVDTYLRIKAAGFPASLNFVWAMYAGLMDTDINRLPPEFKDAVKAEIGSAQR
jgi:hypothetical protein